MVFLFAIITSRMKQNFHQQFESQSEIIKSVVHDVCAVLIENFKAIFDEKKKIDAIINSESICFNKT